MFHENLKHLCEKYHISYRQLAEYMQVKESDIEDWIAGRSVPDLLQIQKLAQAFQVSISVLLGDESEQNQPVQTVVKRKRRKVKHKTHVKTKHVKDKKHSASFWILMILLIVLVIAITAGIYVFWEYSDQYMIVEKPNISEQTENEAEKKEPETEEENDEILDLIGTYRSTTDMLEVISIFDSHVIFTLSSVNPKDPTQIAVLESNEGMLKGNTITFTFLDDGYGNSGSGSIVFEDQTAIYHITFDQEVTSWSMPEYGILYK